MNVDSLDVAISNYKSVYAVLKTRSVIEMLLHLNRAYNSGGPCNRCQKQLCVKSDILFLPPANSLNLCLDGGQEKICCCLMLYTTILAIVFLPLVQMIKTKNLVNLT